MYPAHVLVYLTTRIKPRYKYATLYVADKAASLVDTELIVLAIYFFLEKVSVS
jgi:hypothetical protein